jgi:3-hydroxyacyl-[acyl-carrier-protein] dehydratase
VNLPLDRKAIESLLPHRGEILLVDRVIALEPGVRAVGIKDVRSDEWWTSGHFPGNPIMPGVLIAEALAQVAGLLYMGADAPGQKREMFLVGIDRLRFRKLVQPGDTLELEVKSGRQRRRIWWFDVCARVGDAVVADGQMMATVREVSAE